MLVTDIKWDTDGDEELESMEQVEDFAVSKCFCMI